MQTLLAAKTTLLGKFCSAILFMYAASTGIASAEEFTITGGESELREVLETVATNQQDDVINIDIDFDLTSTINIVNEPQYSLTINGGRFQPLDFENGGDRFRLMQITGSNPSGVSRLVLNGVRFDGGRHDTGTEQVIDAGGAALYSEGIAVEINRGDFRDNLLVGNGSGGAVLVANSSLSIANSIFARNEAIAMGEGALTSGGAIATANGSQISVRQSTFVDNSASRGGAIAPVNQSGTTSILQSTFSRNTAESLGGAIWTRSKVEIELSTFSGNNADVGGGVMYFQPSNNSASGSFLHRNTLVANTGGNVGGALFFVSNIARLELAANLIIGRNTESSNNLDLVNPNNPNCAESGAPATASKDLFAVQLNNISNDDSCGTATFIRNGADLFTAGGQLTFTGGVNSTIALQPESVAIDAGGAPGEVGCTTDSGQRGFDVIGNCDVGSVEFQPVALDTDNDGFPDDDDNCPAVSNPSQSNDVSPGDGIGDACSDFDADGLNDDLDNCPVIANANQENLDNDFFGDICDDDIDGDGTNNDDDSFPRDDSETTDTDNDGIGNRSDTDDDDDGQSDLHELQCESDPLDSLSFSPDADDDGIPDCAESDVDNDGIADDDDNCRTIANEDQLDTDSDGRGDFCDGDDDNDGVPDIDDAFPTDASESVDTDGDGTGNKADTDDDGDGQSDAHELECRSNPLDAGSTSADADNDGIPDCVDPDFVVVVDTDGDGVSDDLDNCPATANPNQEDADGNGVGDACEIQDDLQPVTVYQHINFGGSSLSVGEGDVSIGDLRASSVGNDRISSIEIAPGYEVTACQHSGLRGRCETFTSSVSDLRDISFNDAISSLLVRRVTEQPVTVYVHVNFSGDSLSVGEGDLSFGDLRASSVGNDRISSIIIAPGYEVTACQHSGLRGRCETFTGTVTDLRGISFNDVISSLRVRKVTEQPVTVFENSSFSGNSLSVGEGDLSFGELRASSVGNDRISSVIIAPGYEVIACQHSGFRGRCEAFTGTVTDLRGIGFNNAISSLRVQAL